MSSLAAARADNYYYPREWRPEHGSLNRFHGSHPLGKRAKDAASGVLVVRFEMPFDAVCEACDARIGRGVRFNARKSQHGAYLSTPIYHFELKCPSCKAEMRVRTDPEARGYCMVSGIRKKVDAADAEAIARRETGGSRSDFDRSTERLNDPEIAQRIRDDPFFQLEHEADDKRAARERARGMDALVERQDAQFRDDYASNSKLRAAFRSEKKRIQGREKEADRLALGIPLLDVHPDDVVAAKSVVFHAIPGKKRASSSGSRKVTLKTDKRLSHHKTSSSSSNRDSFQHFGDPMASKLHQMKQRARERKRKQASGLQVSSTKRLRR